MNGYELRHKHPRNQRMRFWRKHCGDCGDCGQLQFTWNKLRCEDICRSNLFKTIIIILTLKIALNMRVDSQQESKNAVIHLFCSLFVFYFTQHLSTFRVCLLSSNLSTSFSGAISLGGGLLCVGTSSMSFPCSPYAITFWSLLLSFSEINSRKKNYHFLIRPRIKGWVFHWISRSTWVSHFRIRLNPLTPKIWLLILPCGCYTFPCKLVMRT